MPCSSSEDAHGTSYTIPAAATAQTAGPYARYLRGYPAVDVWWSRSFKAKAEETLVIRQEYEDRATADVLELTFGQVYDLIEALNKAVEAA